MYIFTYIFRRGNTPLAPPGQHLWTRCIYHIYLLGGATPPLRSVCNTLPGESVGRLFELFLRNQTGVFAEGRKNKCLGAYIVTSNVFLSMLYPDQLRHLRQQKSHHPYIRKRHRPQMTQRYSHVSSWHLEAAQERLVQKLKKIALSILDICKWFVRARSSPVAIFVFTGID